MTTMPLSVLEALASRYRVERELGAGGMATVFLAEDVKHRRNVALKVLKPELAAILGAERFLKEIEVTANLKHPNILALLVLLSFVAYQLRTNMSVAGARMMSDLGLTQVQLGWVQAAFRRRWRPNSLLEPRPLVEGLRS